MMIPRKKQGSRLKTIMVILGAILVTAAIASIPNWLQQGNIQGIGVEIYSDINQTQRLTNIDWGSIYPGGNKTVLAYIKNVNNTVAVLTLNTTDWQPITAQEYVTLTWNYTDVPLELNAVAPTIFMLTTNQNAGNLTTFTFNMIVTAQEQT